jgi:tetratricopeptide (TPR) repeat protein
VKSPCPELQAAIKAGGRRDYQKAVAILKKLLARPEAPPAARLYLGRSFHMLKDYQKALSAYHDYIRIKPGSPSGYFYAGRTYLALGKPHKAVLAYKRALRLRPDNSLIAAFLGAAYLKSRRSRLALEYLQQAVENPAYTSALSTKEQNRVYKAYLNALLIRGIKLCRRQNYEMGKQMLAFVEAQGVQSPLVYLELARAYRETGDLDSALRQYSEALAFNPEDLRIRWFRASILMVQGKSDDALREIAWIKARDKKLPELPASRVWNSKTVDMFMIQACMANSDWRGAADACKDWIRTWGPDPTIHAFYAEAWRNMDNYRAAANHLERALELSPDDQGLWYDRLDAAWVLRDWKAMRHSLRRLRELGAKGEKIGYFTQLLATAQDNA